MEQTEFMECEERYIERSRELHISSIPANSVRKLDMLHIGNCNARVPMDNGWVDGWVDGVQLT